MMQMICEGVWFGPYTGMLLYGKLGCPLMLGM